VHYACSPKKEINNSAKVAIVIITLEQPRCGLRSRTSPDPGAAGRRLRDVHAEPRFDRHRHGWTADRFGARRVFSAAIVVFTLGSIGCGMANSLAALVGARIL